MPLTSRLRTPVISNAELSITDGGVNIDNSDETYHPLILNNYATVWEDLRVPVSSTSKGGSKDPTFVKFVDDAAGTSQGIFVESFSASIEEELYFSCQIPHSYKIGSDIYPHVHWGPDSTNTGNIIWGLEYVWASIFDVFPLNSTIITATTAASGTVNDHILSIFDPIDGTGKNISSMLLCRIFRKAADSGDTFTGEGCLYEIDFHFEIDTIGSRYEFIK